MRARAIAVALLLMLSAACTAAYRGDARPIAPGDVRAADGWVRAAAPAIAQLADADCGAAALAMVVQRWRPALDRAAIARVAPPQDGGISLGRLRDLARAEGLDAYAIAGDHATIVHELRLGRPLVVGLVRPYEGGQARSHYEVIIAAHPDGRVVTIDPADAGWRVRSPAGLDAEWAPGGYPTLVVLGPQAR